MEDFVRAQYFAHFGARLQRFMPWLVALHAPCGTLRAAAGYRCAGAEKLFLEAYARMPVERIIAEKLGVEVPRARLVEVGGLACRSALAAVELVTALTPLLIDAGYEWVVFTGTDSLRTVFGRLDLVPQVLCTADRAALGAEKKNWGSYYEHDPVVMAGRLADGMAAVDCALQGL